VYSPDQSGTVSLAYGRSPGTYDRQTALQALTAGMPAEVTLEGLAPDTRYCYRLQYQAAGDAVPASTDESTFHTARRAGSTFTFTLQGDSHPERDRTQFDADLYARTLLTAAADQPDFHLTIGDDFSVDTLDPSTVTAAQVVERYALQRPFLGLIGRAAPVFLVNGNHEQAARYLLDGTPNNVAIWAQNARNSHYSQPAPDGFYTGKSELVSHIGILRNYFAWTWGDALFVVIDPYWGSSVCVDEPFHGGPRRTNLWDVTLGEAQYQWLKRTLEQSSAKYRFVLAHHVLGTGRGGIELAAMRLPTIRQLAARPDGRSPANSSHSVPPRKFPPSGR
jgi:Calcineurin-like phosphoesterase